MCMSPHTSQVLWKAPLAVWHFALPISLSRIIHETQDFGLPQEYVFLSNTKTLYLCMGTAPLSFQSEAAWVSVWTGSKDAWKQPPLFSDALNHSFPEESWRIPRLSQIQLCLFRCWLHTQQEQSSGRPGSHCILGSATQNKLTQKTPSPKKPKTNKKKPPKPQTTEKSHLCHFFMAIQTFP